MKAFGWSLLAVLALGGGAAAYWSLRPLSVPLLQVERGTVQQTVLASGSVSPPAELRLGTLVSTTADEVLVDEGALVTEGQVLVRLNSAEAQASVAEARARLASARAGRTELKKLSGPAAKARLEEAEANFLRTQARQRREKQLHASGVGTDVELEDAENALTLAKAQRSAAVLQVQSASHGGSQYLATDAAVAQAQAQLRAAEERLRKHTIVAPSAGLVLARNVEPGDAVAAGAVLILLSRTGQTRIHIEPDERMLGFIEIGQEALASTEAFPERQFGAKVSAIAPAVDPKRGTIEVELVVEEPPDYLRPHMTTSVEILVREKEKALTVPRGAILGIRQSPQVAKLVKGRIRFSSVELGVRGDERVEIIKGLTEGERVIAQPQGLAEGLRAAGTTEAGASAERAQ